MTSNVSALGIGRRRLMVLPVALAGLSMLGPFTVDTPFPAFGQIAGDFEVGESATQQIVGLYLFAFGIMSIFHGPLSDALGRRSVMLGGLAVYVVATVGAALAPTMEVLLVCRVFQGLSAGGGVIVSRIVVRDLYSGAEAQRLMSRVMMIFGVAPALAPIIGGWILYLGSWRVIFWFLALLTCLLMLVVLVVIPETHPPANRSPLSVRGVLGGLVTVGASPRFMRVAWTGTFLFAAYFLYIGSAAIVVIDLLGQGPRGFWVLFVPMIVGFMFGSALSGRLADRVSSTRFVTSAVILAVVCGAANVAIAYGTSALPWVVLGPGLIGIAIGLGYPATQLLCMNMFDRHRGAAASLATFMSLMLNAFLASVVAPFVTGSLVTLAWTCAGLVTAGAVLWSLHLALERDSQAATPSP